MKSQFFVVLFLGAILLNNNFDVLQAQEAKPPESSSLNNLAPQSAPLNNLSPGSAPIKAPLINNSSPISAPPLINNNSAPFNINAICNTTIDPPFCVNFLHSDPRFDNATTLKGLARITLHKAKSNATSTMTLAGTLKPQNPPLWHQLEACMKNINTSIAYLEHARASVVSSGSPDNLQNFPGRMNIFASAALDEVDACGVNLGAAEPPELKLERQILDNIIRILIALASQP